MKKSQQRNSGLATTKQVRTADTDKDLPNILQCQKSYIRTADNSEGDKGKQG
jgi:hypothetical protein